jgi:hypothetical protein
MKVLVDSIRTEIPRPRSPHMNNEEPIELAHFPAAKRPGPGEKPKIERDDFPAPPYAYTDPGECAQNCIFYHTCSLFKNIRICNEPNFELEPTRTCQNVTFNNFFFLVQISDTIADYKIWEMQ